MVCAPHWQIDGIGAPAYFLRGRSPASSLEIRHRRKELFARVGRNCWYPHLCDNWRRRSGFEVVEPDYRQCTVHCLPSNFNNPVLGTTRREMLMLSPFTTSKIVRACKIHDFSVTPALHAGLIPATKQTEMSRPSTQKRYTSWARFSLRAY